MIGPLEHKNRTLLFLIVYDFDRVFLDIFKKHFNKYKVIFFMKINKIFLFNLK